MSGKIKLLVVDDEKRFLSTLSQRLRMRNFDVTAVSTGKEAIEVARDGVFDLALVDLKMPGMNGEQVLKLLKINDPYIEVIILTGHGSLESSVACSKLGSFGYLQKPCETFELLQILKEAYKSRVRQKMRLSDAQMSELTEDASSEDQMQLFKILKKAEECGAH